MPEALASPGGRRSAGVRLSACTRAPGADSRLDTSSAIFCRVQGQLPMLAPARVSAPTPFVGFVVAGRRVRTTPSWPSLARLATRGLPIKPDPPLTRTFILLLCSPKRAGTTIGRRPDQAPTLPSPGGGGVPDSGVEATGAAFGASLLQAFV